MVDVFPGMHQPLPLQESREPGAAARARPPSQRLCARPLPAAVPTARRAQHAPQCELL